MPRQGRSALVADTRPGLTGFAESARRRPEGSGGAPDDEGGQGGTGTAAGDGERGHRGGRARRSDPGHARTGGVRAAGAAGATPREGRDPGAFRRGGTAGVRPGRAGVGAPAGRGDPTRNGVPAMPPQRDRTATGAGTAALETAG
ncbi:hypothetical protein GCM10010398_55080 [Streptomyces fimbriatus]